MLVSGRQWPWRCHLQPGPGQRDTMEANFTIQHILNSLLEFISYWTCFTGSLPGSVSMSWSCSQWQSSLCQPSNNRMCYDCFALNLWRSLLLFCAWFWRLFGKPTHHKCKFILAAGSPVLTHVLSIRLDIIDTITPRLGTIMPLICRWGTECATLCYLRGPGGGAI